ncbi:hypothetical protein SAMN05444000_109118 [Shimia gijangensis]|uniref:Glycosyl transferase family 2 n=1 Tax=Shimia gijangensis TaxID=1470563 RepID=A0A1M6JTW9_9RHOB|nr:hypothetical protein [Shimia gijangensis]SHJ50121.1 hypothetical protein SAMN05444000_109118 [Shimia gijangensis]
MNWLLALVAIGVGLALWIHYTFEGESLLRNLWREWRLGRRSLNEWDREWQHSTSKSDVVVSLTTIPSRMGVVDTALKGLMDQSRPPKRIYLNVPEWSKRENCVYEVPEHLTNLSSLVVRRCEDWGPATKVIPTLLAEDADQLIMVVDDDRIYPRNTLAAIEQQAASHPDKALGCAGWVVPKDFLDRPTTILSNLLKQPPAPIRGHRTRKPVEIDVLLGVFGYALRPRFFDLGRLTDFSDTPRAAFLVDDVRTSALCRVAKFVVPIRCLSFLPLRRRRQYTESALAHLNRGDGDLESRNNTKAIQHFRDLWRVGGNNLQ